MKRMRLYTADNYNYTTESKDAPCLLQGVYFHGDAEAILGHDIICVPRNAIVLEGIYPFEVIDSTHNHQIVTGMLYVWDGKFSQRGLAIADGDKSGHIYAQSCFDNKKNML